jgi:hypothetical protein
MEVFRNSAGDIVPVQRVRGLARLVVEEYVASPDADVCTEDPIQSSQELTIFKRDK